MAFEEAVASFCSPQQLRLLICIMAIGGSPISELFDKNKDRLTVDFENDLIDTVPDVQTRKHMAYQRLLHAISDTISAFGQIPSTFGLPLPDKDPDPQRELQSELNRERSRYNVTALGSFVRDHQLSEEQQGVSKQLIDAVTSGKGGCFFLLQASAGLRQDVPCASCCR